jgi:hypothetical protein
MGKIYKLIDPRNNKVRYIGITCKPLKERLEQHLRETRTSKNTHKLNWLRTLVKLNLKPRIKRIKKVNPENWARWEIFYISKYKKSLTNTTSGGKGCYGERVSEKISKALTGKTGKLCPNSQGIIAYKENEDELFFYSQNEAVKYFREVLGINITRGNANACAKGKRKTCGGYKWKRP